MFHLGKLFNRLRRNDAGAELFKHEVTLILEKGVIPQVEKLNEDSIADVVKVMSDAGATR